VLDVYRPEDAERDVSEAARLEAVICDGVFLRLEESPKLGLRDYLLTNPSYQLKAFFYVHRVDQTLGGANKTLMESVRVVTIKYHRGDDEAEDQDGVGQMGRRDQSVQLRVDHDSAEEDLEQEEDGCE